MCETFYCIDQDVHDDFFAFSLDILRLVTDFDTGGDFPFVWLPDALEHLDECCFSDAVFTQHTDNLSFVDFTVLCADAERVELLSEIIPFAQYFALALLHFGRAFESDLFLSESD